MRDLYDDALSLGEARQQYFAANGFGDDGGYDTDWVDVKIGPIPARIPNTAGRKRAVPFHDLHHVVTGYRTTFRGECEIGAWEVASGCGDHWVAWLLNFGVFGAGLLFAIGDVWRAFLLGRRSQNLYHSNLSNALLATPLRDVRRDLGIPDTLPPARAVDRAAFVAWSFVALLAIGSLILFGPIVLPATALVSRIGRE